MPLAMRWHTGPLSQLWQVAGKGQALWITPFWFGLGHYYGSISFGAIAAAFFTLVAVLFGKAIVETKGPAVPIGVHLLSDVVLYIILALSST